MENQERHNKKIELLAKCMDAGAITLQEALTLLDADVVPDVKPASSDPGHTAWKPYTYPTITPYSQPLSGTIMGSSTILTTAGTSGTSISTTVPVGSAITYTNTVGSSSESTV